MEERKTVDFKKKEYKVKEFIKGVLEKGKFSKVRLEYSPVGERIIISTHKPGLIIGRKGEIIGELTRILKSNFKLENPNIEIEEIMQPEFDAQLNADEIALGLERFGPLKFKVLAYKTLQRIMSAGAQGAEIVLGGKLPGSRAKTWRFSKGYLKKTGDSSKLVDKAKSRAQTKPGTVGIKVSILSPYVNLKDKIKVDEELIKKLKENCVEKPKQIKLKKTKEKK